MTARILVVADNRSLSLGLTGQDFDVVDLRPDELTGWSESNSPDLVLVGVDSPADAVDIVGTCQARHEGVRVLLVASKAPGWSSVGQLENSDVEILTLPVSRLSLVNAVHRAVDASAAASAPAAEDQPAPPVDVVNQPADEPVVPSPHSVDAAPAPEVDPATRTKHRPAQERIVAARSTDGLRERLAHLPAPTPEQASAPVLESRPPDVLPAPVTTPAHRSVVHHTSPREQSAEWSLVREATTTTAAQVSPAARSGSTHELVTELLTHVDELVDVRDGANALVEEAAALADAAYGAVLLPDDGVWRVCGATGMRPLEWRYVVEADSWLATTVIDGKRGVIVEDSDIARQRLGGAPLAHHQHLLAAPVPNAEGLVILARDTDAFDESQLSAVAAACADAGALLADALQVRALARALGDFRDVDG